MKGLCGWTQTSSLADDARGTLEAMTAGMAARRSGDTTPAMGPGHAWAQTGGSSAADGSVQAVLVGEPFWTDGDLRQTAEAHGHATALLHAYRDHDTGLFTHLHGTFSLVLHDTGAERTLIAVDRMGIQRLCYSALPQALVFGSLIGSVAAHPQVSTAVDPQAVFDYLYFHMIPAPQTIYTSVNKLGPGEFGIWEKGRFSVKPYWRLHFQDRNGASFDELAAEFRGLLRTSVRRGLDDESVGAFLSGGTDSSTMAGVLTEVLGRPAKTFSIGFAAEGFDETEYARAAVRHFGTEHHEYYVTPADVVDAAPRVAQAYDEPFGNASAIPTYYCARMARDNGVTRLIAGDGGDEIFAGNERYLKQQIFEYYYLLPGVLRNHLIQPLVAHMPGRSAVPLLRKLHSYVEQASIPLPDRLETYNFLRRTAVGEILPADFLAQVDTAVPADMQRRVYGGADSKSALNRMLHLDFKFTLADNDLRKVSHMCDLAGVDVCYPLLDDELVDFSARVPPGLKIKGRRLRYFFKEALRDFLPQSTLTKSKHGFGLPFGLWLNDYAPLHELAESSLRGLTERGYLNPGYVELLWKQHRTEHSTYYGTMIWVLMMLELWLQSHPG
jgi:asparagine synthase (glutamine-hydrolysing)